MLQEKIKKMIEKEAMKIGIMGTESCTVTLTLTDAEKAEFLNLDDFDSNNYWWDFDGNELTITYTEEILIKTITDKDNGRKWEIYKKSDNEYFYKYYEFFKQLGWHFTGIKGDSNNGYLTKDCIEHDFDITI